MKKFIHPEDMEYDFYGNNAAFTCPCCNKVFIVSGHFHKNGRKCPVCEKFTGFVIGGQKLGGQAYLED